MGRFKGRRGAPPFCWFHVFFVNFPLHETDRQALLQVRILLMPTPHTDLASRRRYEIAVMSRYLIEVGLRGWSWPPDRVGEGRIGRAIQTCWSRTLQEHLVPACDHGVRRHPRPHLSLFAVKPSHSRCRHRQGRRCLAREAAVVPNHDDQPGAPRQQLRGAHLLPLLDMPKLRYIPALLPPASRRGPFKMTRDIRPPPFRASQAKNREVTLRRNRMGPGKRIGRFEVPSSGSALPLFRPLALPPSRWPNRIKALHSSTVRARLVRLWRSQQSTDRESFAAVGAREGSSRTSMAGADRRLKTCATVGHGCGERGAAAWTTWKRIYRRQSWMKPAPVFSGLSRLRKAIAPT